jgi:hypothetical protein
MKKLLAAAVLGALVATGLAGGIALAAIPGPDGVIQGCYDSGGNVKVVSALPCPRNYTPFQWNQSGPQGEPGAPGAPGTPGTPGANGVSPSVTALAAGDPNCPAGGAAITDAAGSTAYVCSGQDGDDGEPFSGTFTSPNGEYSISVADDGITLARAGGSVIQLSGNDITVQSAGAYLASAGSNLSLTSGSGFSLTSGAGMTTAVGTNLQTTVGGSAATTIGTNAQTTIGGDAVTSIGSDAMTSISGNLTLAVDSDAEITVHDDFQLQSAGTATVQSSAALSLDGSMVRVNAGSGCPRAARLGDLVNLATGAIIGGSSTVCIG